MPLSDKEIRDLRPTSKRQRVSCGDSLLVVVESVGRGGGKSFLGTTASRLADRANRSTSELASTGKEQANGPLRRQGRSGNA